eukprot:gi/632989717/ref/XP_007883798.1/ PREDICTED: proline-rich transmembrane protein 4 [Callorhinchus milii]
MAALAVKRREVHQTHQLSSQAPHSQAPHSQAPHSQASDSFTIRSHKDLTIGLSLTPSGLPEATEEPLLASLASPALPEETGAGELVTSWGVATGSSGLGTWSMQPRLRVGPDDKAKSGVLFNQRVFGLNPQLEQLDIGTSGSEEHSEIEASGLTDPSHWWASSTGEPSPNPLDPATQNGPRLSPQDMPSEHSVSPIYTFPGSPERWVTVQTPSHTPETPSQRETPPQTTPDMSVSSHMVPSFVSQPPPGFSSPAPRSGAATEPATVRPAATDHTTAEPGDVSRSATAVPPGDTITGGNTVGTGPSPSEGTRASSEVIPNYKSSPTPTHPTESHPTPTKPPQASNQTHQTAQSTTAGDARGEKRLTGEEPGAVPTLPTCSLRGNSSDGAASVTPYPEGTQTGLLHLPLPPLFVSLGVEWSTALAEWGVAWELHVYGLGAVFGLVSLASSLGLLCLPFRSPPPPRLGFLLLAEVLLLLSGFSRAFTFLYDTYGHRENLPALVALLLYELVSPFLASALGVVFLLLWLGPGPQVLGYWCPRACLLASLAGFHCALSLSAVLGCVLLDLSPFLLLASQVLFVLWVSALSILYLTFYCRSRRAYQRAEASPLDSGLLSPERREWGLAVQAGAWASGFGLCCAGVRLYCVLRWLGLAGPQAFPAWPWWALQLCGSLCEGGLCLSLALVGLYPLLGLVGRPPGHSCWAKVFGLSPAHASMKAPILSAQYNWASGNQEKPLGLQLYSLADPPLGNGERLNLIYHSSETTQAETTQHEGSSPAPSSSSFSVVRVTGDSSVDLRPPSPIDLRRSIDEALLPGSLFRRPRLHSAGGPGLGGDVSVAADRHGALDCFSPSGSCLVLSACPPSPELGSQGRGGSANGAPRPGTAGDTAEFVQICRQIDQLSVNSDTIEL